MEATATTATVEELLVLNGTVDVRWEGVHFSYATWSGSSGPGGYVDIQSAYLCQQGEPPVNVHVLASTNVSVSPASWWQAVPAKPSPNRTLYASHGAVPVVHHATPTLARTPWVGGSPMSPASALQLLVGHEATARKLALMPRLQPRTQAQAPRRRCKPRANVPDGRVAMRGVPTDQGDVPCAWCARAGACQVRNASILREGAMSPALAQQLLVLRGRVSRLFRGFCEVFKVSSSCVAKCVFVTPWRAEVGGREP